ncbi:MAG: hypothetical protein R2762_26920 [Bryobacteraceae bacterium]
MRARVLSTIAAAMFSAALSQAAPITYIFTGTASGELAGTPFSNVLLTVTAPGDTSAIISFNGAFFNTVPVASVNIPGLGSFNFLGSAYVFDHPGNGVVGFGIGGDIIQHYDNPYLTYDLASAFGPNLYPPDNPSVPNWTNIGTSGGLMTVRAMDNNSFQAVTTAAPEPSSLAFLLLGAVCCTVRARYERIRNSS